MNTGDPGNTNARDEGTSGGAVIEAREAGKPQVCHTAEAVAVCSRALWRLAVASSVWRGFCHTDPSKMLV